jgi:peptidoglycan/LPS O-acetylase OafA/YrhL
MTTQGTAAPPRLRLGFLDGMRALAAWYVVLHHMWIESYPGFPQNTGPWMVGWLRWGHLAVAVFIVLSGFSLMLGPARNDDRTVGGNVEFFRRRSWRILPPYWAALVLSMLTIVLFTGQYTGQTVSLRTVVVYGLLLQDLVFAPTPNGAFWSIALEWHIYFLFPLFLWMTRRWGQTAMVLSTTAVIVGLYLVTSTGGVFTKYLTLTPQFVVLFVLGMAAGRSLVRRDAPGEGAVRLLGGATAVSLVVLAVVLAVVEPARLYDPVVQGGATLVVFFWLDLVVGAVTALLCFALGSGALPGVARVLAVRPLVWLGAFSYSVYLIHYPVMMTVKVGIADRIADTQLQQYLVLVALGVPAVGAAAYGFYRLVERPSIERRWPLAVRRSLTTP